MSDWEAEWPGEEQRTENNEREVDKEYLGLLERRLHSVKNPTGKKATAKQFISDIASVKDHQLFNLLTADSTETNKFDDDFIDQVIQPSLIQRKLVPQSCAVATSEKLKLVKNDHVQKIVDLLEEEGKERKEEEKEEEKEEKPVKDDAGWAKFEELEETKEEDTTTDKSKKD